MLDRKRREVPFSLADFSRGYTNQVRRCGLNEKGGS
jgi:hypothetical protein